MNTNIKVGITQGDMNGIGYEIILKTLVDSRLSEICIPIVYGSSKAIAYHRKALNFPDINITRIETPQDATQHKNYIINCLDDSIRIELGKSTPEAGEASFKVLKRAADDLKRNSIDVLVTCPINKHNMQSAQFSFPGHTEYLRSVYGKNEVLMLMVNNLMRIGVVAGHVPLAKIPSMITVENIMNKLKLLHDSLICDFGIRKPKIAVLGLNPHAGDNGVLGNEEKDYIIPAIEKAQANNMLVFGPYPADGFFAAVSYKKFDGVLAMYHDQGLAPFKALDTASGVNFTAGLPGVRTSPAHGTAYDIAGLNQAMPDSLRQAIYLGIDIFRNREMYREITANPLKSNMPGTERE